MGTGLCQKDPTFFHLANWDLKPLVHTSTVLLPPVSDPSKSSENRAFFPPLLQDFPTLKNNIPPDEEAENVPSQRPGLDASNPLLPNLGAFGNLLLPPSPPPLSPSSVHILGSEVKATAQPLPSTNKYQPLENQLNIPSCVGPGWLGRSF